MIEPILKNRQYLNIAQTFNRSLTRSTMGRSAGAQSTRESSSRLSQRESIWSESIHPQ
jgi:hypothetical protein